jgi:hypothetical protein
MWLEVGKVKVRVHVVHDEGDELAATPEHSAEEAAGVELVGEVSKEHPNSYGGPRTSSMQKMTGAPSGRSP